MAWKEGQERIDVENVYAEPTSFIPLPNWVAFNGILFSLSRTMPMKYVKIIWNGREKKSKAIFIC